MSASSRLIVVSGPPGTGKTTLARRLADEFSLPLVTKDGIKEALFDALGWSDRAWSKRVGVASYELLFGFAESLMAARVSLILEANFDSRLHSARLRGLAERFDFSVLQIQCKAQGEVLYRRFKERAGSPERHPGHVDAENHIEFMGQLLEGKYAPLEIGGELFWVDTTDFGKVDDAAISEAVGAFLAR